ncbi:uncharacterized protein DDB_G0287625-like [Diaphorina citri]|uniref:Uncharacterized protein DDB_G0287625-like n=1 Tax=Diaphorina citri TaxID=121845 RepID=A0A3Q0J532_DIACI|nr:uncharacterized protein DDB_G0287625-like [Diaphorina citri]
MAEKKFTDQMRDMCDNWNLSKDSALLEHLQKMSENVIKESEGVLDMVKEVEFDVNKTAISVASCRNSLQALSDTQFIENKIEEIEEVENTSESIEVCEKDDLFAIPKKSTNHKTNMTDPTKSKLNSENVTNSNNDTSSNLFDETKIKANTLMSSIIENKTPGINNDSNEPVVKTPSNMSNESKSKAPEVITNLNAHKTPESLINSIEKSSTTNSSSDLFSEDTDNFESPEIITSLSVEHNVEVPLPPSKNNLDGSANKLPKENTSVRKEGNHLNNNSESESVNNQEIEKKPNVEKGGNELEKDIKAPRKSPNAKDELDLFKDDKKESLGNRRIELFNSQDSDNSDDDLWGNVPKSKSLENSNNVKNTEYTHENTVSESISSMSDKALKVTDEKSTTDEALEIEDNKRETKVEVLNDKVSADHIECINNPITTEEHGSPNIGEIKKSLNLFGNIGSKAENIEEDKGKSNVPSSKVHSLVNSYSLSSESEPSSPLFPEDKSVRSVKVTPEAKIITKTDKDNPDGLVSSIVRKPVKPFEQDQKKVSFLDNSDDEDDIFRDISIKSDTKKVPQINQNSSVSKTAEINPTLTETKTTNEAVSETILTKKEEESTLKVSKNVDTLEILKPLNEDQSNESNIKNTNNINNVSDPAEGRKKLFTNANKMKNTNFLFNDDDDDDEDDLFGPTNKTQKSGTINSINKVTSKTEVTKSEINSEKLLDSAIKINKQSEISIERNEPVKQTKIGHEKREENSNENETNSTQNTKARSVANTSNPDMNTVLNTKSIVNTQPTKNMSARKSTLFGDDDNDEDLFGSLNKSKTKDNHNNNNNKVESKTNKFFSDNQSDDDDDLFKSVSKVS